MAVQRLPRPLPVAVRMLGPDGAARSRGERGAAVVDFVFVLLLLVPLVVGILQVGLVMHVRNVLSSAASEGARSAARAGAAPADGVTTARRQWQGVVSDDFVRDIRVKAVTVQGVPAYRVEVTAVVPALGLGGPGVEFSVAGSAVREVLPDEVP